MTELEKRHIGDISRGNTYAKDFAEKRLQKDITSLKLLFSKHRNIKEVYRSSSIGRRLRERHNQSYKTKYTIDHFYKFIKKHIEVEMISSITGKNISRIQRVDHYKYISLKCVGDKI